MIAHIHGKLVIATPSHVVIEAAGVGYKIYITALTYGKLPALQCEMLMHTVHVIREQSQALYGFLQPHACDLFETLLSVSGVGPKLALSILGHMTESEFAQALTDEDVTTLSRVPGIGKKTAQRLIIEVRDKLPIPEFSIGHNAPSAAFAGFENPTWKLAVNALVNLGYTQPVAHKAIKKTLQQHENTSDLALIIAESLKNV